MSRRPRFVLHVITRMIVGGAQENTLFSVVGTDAEPGWRSELATGPSLGPEGELLQPGAARIHPVPFLRRAIHPIHDLLAFAQLWWLCIRLRPDVVHTHSSKAGILGRLAARLAGVPVVVHTIHGLPYHRYQGRAAHLLYVLCERLLARCADRIYAVAQAMVDQALAVGAGNPERYEVVHSGMDVRPFLEAGEDAQLRALTRQRFGIAEDDLVVTIVARLFELKGHDDVLAILPELHRRVPRALLLVVGDGERRAELEERVQAMGLATRVRFVGLLAPGDIPAALAASDLLVHTSLREGLARVLPQALLSRRPVISYDIDGAREVVRHEETGVLLQPGDHAGLLSWCVRLLENPWLAEELAVQGRDLCRDLFPRERMVWRLLASYAGLLRGGELPLVDCGKVEPYPGGTAQDF